MPILGKTWFAEGLEHCSVADVKEVGVGNAAEGKRAATEHLSYTSPA
ncbi:MAG TPA: hypothetical protein VHI52_16605 [Verrucomicrobiae bacterium]|nr:hypothetical protein [Verrucomicrobiae bacterium]